jgi:4-alpha-glucanotransferase
MRSRSAESCTDLAAVAVGHWRFGASAFRFIDWLAEYDQACNKSCHLADRYGDSPYQCFSAFAGNPLLVSLDKMADDGLLDRQELQAAPHWSDDAIDYGAVLNVKLPLLRRSFERVRGGELPAQARAFDEFCAAQANWLDDYALFMALKEQHGGARWDTWEPDAKRAPRQPAALERWRDKLADPLAAFKYSQFLFFSHWQQVKAYAHERGIRIIGDAPIFVAYDSADVWAQPDLFYLDVEGCPTVVAGVPPDYFSATGQLWGNPLYRWDRMAETGYSWWVARIKAMLALVDIVRLDHFRGFEAYWEVPAGEPTAASGRWVKGPGAALFEALGRALGGLPIIAEDLGLITPPVVALRERFSFPGMKVLQFAFGGDAEDPYLPHNYAQNCIVYTGTHDNDTTLGWFSTQRGRAWAVALPGPRWQRYRLGYAAAGVRFGGRCGHCAPPRRVAAG